MRTRWRESVLPHSASPHTVLGRYTHARSDRGPGAPKVHIMKTLVPICSTTLVLLLSLSACDMGRDPAPASVGNPSTPQANAVTPPPEPKPSPVPAPDNTARNRADAPGGSGSSADTKTPMDQSESAAHIKITAEIRKAVMAIDGISTNAKNCKIITDATGTVTLRGVVDSQSEKETIETRARAVSGVTKVDNQLEVKTR